MNKTTVYLNYRKARLVPYSGMTENISAMVTVLGETITIMIT